MLNPKEDRGEKVDGFETKIGSVKEEEWKTKKNNVLKRLYSVYSKNKKYRKQIHDQPKITVC